MTQTTGHRISVTSQPHGIVFDGHNLWITGFANDPGANNAVQRIDVNYRTALPIITSPGTSRYRGLVFDGNEVWIAYDVPDCGFACASEHSEIAPIDPLTPTILRSRAQLLAYGFNPVSAVFDGHSIWVADYDGYVTRTYIK
jgi:DNA-binding beta-propeller fold protein YncE